MSLLKRLFKAIMNNLEGNRKQEYRNIPLGYRQEDKSADKKVTEWSLELIKELEWKRFEDVCADYFRMIGYRAETTKLGADGGIDIKLYKDSKNLSGIVQCKAWNTYKVGVSQVRELYGVMAAERVNTGVFMTSGEFTNEAKEFNNGKRMALVDGKKFFELINKLPEEKKMKLFEIATEGDYDVPTCPSCGVKMKARVAKRGKNNGNEFWGCPNYPRCKRVFH